jgi:hypothetical protein
VPDDARPPEPESDEPDRDQDGRRAEDRPRTKRPSVDEVFGEVLPETTSDERRDRSGGRDARDEEILRDVPPHH